MPILHALIVVFSLLMLSRHGPRALLFLLPRSVRIKGDPEAAPHSTGQVAAGEALEPEGFRRLGLRAERGPIGGLDVEVDAWVHPDGTCADVYAVGGRDVAVAFLTELGDGYQVGTANFRRPAARSRRGRLGGLPGARLDAALAAHRKSVAAEAEQHGPPLPVADLDARIATARRYYAGVGGSELRRAALMSVLNAALATLLLVSSLRFALAGLGIGR